MSELRVAVLGAGISGSATALFLARRGAHVTLFEAADRPFAGASRWSEGKIHLGYLYAGEPTLMTARKVIPGGLAFKVLVEELIDQRIETAIAPQNDIHLVHRDSVVNADATERYYQSVTRLVGEHPDARNYLAGASNPRLRKLCPAELRDYDSVAIIAGYELPERAVNTRWIADRFTAAVAAEPGIELLTESLVRAVHPTAGTLDGPLVVHTSRGSFGPFDFVVNATWEGRLAIDASLGLLPSTPWLHRYRLSLFIHTRAPIAARGAIIVTGPFGDLKSYNDSTFYLSWYPAGLLAQGSEVAPPPLPRFNSGDIIDEVFASIGVILPVAHRIRRDADSIELRGGWIFSLGQGRLNEIGSDLHRRDRIGITRRGSYFSVDTGKYSIGPWLARKLADEILGR